MKREHEEDVDDFVGPTPQQEVRKGPTKKRVKFGKLHLDVCLISVLMNFALNISQTRFLDSQLSYYLVQECTKRVICIERTYHS